MSHNDESNEIPEGVAVPETPKPVGPKKLTREDHLLIENLHLKHVNIGMQLNNLQRDAQEAVKQKTEVETKLEDVVVMVKQKYGVDLKKARILEDGTLIEIAEAPPSAVLSR